MTALASDHEDVEEQEEGSARKSDWNAEPAAAAKTLAVFEAIGAAPNGLRSSDIVQLLELPRTTVYRILTGLVDRGLIRKDKRRRMFHLGARFLQLAHDANPAPELLAAAHIELRYLRAATGETAYLSVRDELQTLVLECCHGVHSVRPSSLVGQPKPLHCTSQGKAIVAYLDGEERAAVLKQLTMQRMTDKTIVSRKRLNSELQQVRARGYAIDDEESLPGVRCVGAPIRNAKGEIAGALSVSGPSFRLDQARIDSIGQELVDAARRVNERLVAEVSIKQDARVEPVGEDIRVEGASPVACAEGLFMIDRQGAAVVRVHGGKLQPVHRPGEAPLWLTHDGHALLCGTSESVEALAFGKGKAATSTIMRTWRGTAPSLVCADPEGRLWAAQADGAGGWSLRCLDMQRTERWHLDQQITSLCWSTDGLRLFAACADARTIFVMTLEDTRVRRFVSVPEISGRLGGMATDRNGALWVALRHSWSVVRYSGDGALTKVIGLPVPDPTDLCVDAASQSLYVTTSPAAITAEMASHVSTRSSLLRIDLSGG